MKIVLASNNNGKVAEFNQWFTGSDIDFIPQSEFNVPEAEETGLTFIENAIIKARNACHYTGMPAMGDDSGIEVAALNGAPGIYSARYGAVGANKGPAHTKRLLAEMVDVPPGQRQARLCCVLAYMRHEKDATPIIAQGFCAVEITLAPSGEQGFGYDPVLYLAEQACTMAELSAEMKNQVSHRAHACTSFLQQITMEMKATS